MSNSTDTSNSVIVTLDYVEKYFVRQIPLLFLLVGSFLQATLRKNTFCIYSLIDLVNLLPNYVEKGNNILLTITTSAACKCKLSMNLLILSLIDRYACARQLKMVPCLLILTVIVSGLISIYSFLLYDIVPDYGCSTMNALLNAILYDVIHGLLTPLVVMLVFVWLTYRNLRRSRQREVSRP